MKQAFQAVKARTGEPNAGIQLESHDVHMTMHLCPNVKGLSDSSWPFPADEFTAQIVEDEKK